MEMYIVKVNSNKAKVVRIEGELPDVSDMIQYYSTGKRLFMIQKDRWVHRVIEYNKDKVDGTWKFHTIGKSNKILGKLNPNNMISKEEMVREIEKMRMLVELRK